jgi:hypothetical protein
MSSEFDKKIYAQGIQLAEEGKDANQIAKILCDNGPRAA